MEFLLVWVYAWSLGWTVLLSPQQAPSHRANFTVCNEIAQVAGNRTVADAPIRRFAGLRGLARRSLAGIAPQVAASPTGFLLSGLPVKQVSADKWS